MRRVDTLLGQLEQLAPVGFIEPELATDRLDHLASLHRVRFVIRTQHFDHERRDREPEALAVFSRRTVAARQPVRQPFLQIAHTFSLDGFIQ